MSENKNHQSANIKSDEKNNSNSISINDSFTNSSSPSSQVSPVISGLDVGEEVVCVDDEGEYLNDDEIQQMIQEDQSNDEDNNQNYDEDENLQEDEQEQKGQGKHRKQKKKTRIISLR